MCKTPLHKLLEALPKCEHHMHLEGSLEPNLLFELAGQNKIQLPVDDLAFASEKALLDRYQNFTSLDDFLHYYYICMSVLIHATDFQSLAWQYFQKASADGVIHAEVFFDPQAHLSRGVSYSTLLEGFLAAKEKAENELGMTVELICCFVRHLPVADSLSVLAQPEVRSSFETGKIIGIGLDSTEKEKPPYLFQEIFDNGKKLNLRLTAHAGEEGPPSYIAGALDDLGVERIDHGWRLFQDQNIMKRVKDENIMLTLCPRSNVVLRCVASMADVPIRTFLDAGVKFSINSDDPAYFGGYIQDNYCAVQEAFDLTVKDWESICRASIEGSWCSQQRKETMLRKLSKVVSDWEGK